MTLKGKYFRMDARPRGRLVLLHVNETSIKDPVEAHAMAFMMSADYFEVYKGEFKEAERKDFQFLTEEFFKYYTEITSEEYNQEYQEYKPKTEEE